MSTFFQPYEGKRPYVFISYAHRDSGRVLPLLNGLNDRKLRLWYDEGIPAGSDWPKNIERHMRGSAAVLFFLSEAAMRSANCFSEIRTAVQLNKPVGVVRLDGAQPDGRWAELLESAAILCGGSVPDADAVLQWKQLTRAFYRKRTDRFRTDWIGLILALLLFLGAVAGLIALLNHNPEPPDVPATPHPTAIAESEATAAPIPTPTVDPGLFPVVFPDVQQENAVRGAIKKPDGDVLRPDLARVTELVFCGHMTLQNTDSVTTDADGTVRVNGAPVIAGRVADLSVIGQMAFLERLALIDQPMTDLKPLNGLVLLRELDLRASAVTDLSALTDLPNLSILHLEHTQVSDLTPLSALPSLNTVTVSADMLPLSWTEDKPFRVILVP